MIEEQLGDRMRAVLADEPPLGFDPDELVDRAGRSRRQRRTTVAAAGAVLVVAVSAVVATSGGGDRGSRVGTSSTAPAACRDVEPGRVPPLNFPGSAAIVARLDAAVPGLVARHLPGVTVQPSETGMIAYDCPRNVGTLYPVAGANQTLVIDLIHAGDELDLAHDKYAGDAEYHLVAEDTAADGARFRTYGNSAGTVLIVVRFGLDGMITEASIGGMGTPVVDAAQLRALAG